MILLVGPANDAPLRAVGAALREMGADYICLGDDVQIVKPWTPDGEAVLQVSGREIALEEVKSAYLRPFALPLDYSKSRGAMETLLAWADCSTARIVNRPSASLPNTSKPLQCEWIRKFGLKVPETLVTTDPAAAREFALRHGEVVYKSTSGERSIVRRLSQERYEQLSDVANCPTQFQQYIPGDEVRVHVIGETVEALEVRSDCDDYRYASRNGGQTQAERIELDAATAESLRAMVKKMGLLLAGVDLRRTPAGDIYCLEVNPSPGFTYYEQLAGIRLAGKIAGLLVESINACSG